MTEDACENGRRCQSKDPTNQHKQNTTHAPTRIALSTLKSTIDHPTERKSLYEAIHANERIDKAPLGAKGPNTPPSDDRYVPRLACTSLSRHDSTGQGMPQHHQGHIFPRELRRSDFTKTQLKHCRLVLHYIGTRLSFVMDSSSLGIIRHRHMTKNSPERTTA